MREKPCNNKKKVKEQDWQKIEQDIPITNADKSGAAGNVIDIKDFIWEAEWQYNTNTPSMKPTLTLWGGLSYQEVFTQRINK